VLGNHDFVEIVPPLEAAGLRFLLNESIAVERGGDRLHLVGVDDPHYYETDNLEDALAGLPDDEPKVLLCHSPELYRPAAACGLDLMLCGHTHAGQICLPGGIPLLTNARCPRRLRVGAWRYRELAGYTSAGTGSCGVPVRFFCPPEMTLHELRRKSR
jgi:predicted MPP superfamily phosphohydrolase